MCIRDSTQYNSIMRLYEQRQTKNRHLRDERLHYVYNHVTGYRNLDESVATLSVAPVSYTHLDVYKRQLVA